MSAQPDTVHPGWIATAYVDQPEASLDAFPSWLPEAAARYAAGEGLNTLNAAYRADMSHWFAKAGIPTRSHAEAWELIHKRQLGSRVLRTSDPEQITEWINAGRDLVLDVNLARLAESNAHDEVHSPTADLAGPEYWRTRWGAP